MATNQLGGLNLYKKQVRLEIRDVRARFSLAAGGWVYLNPHMSPEKPTYDAPFWYPLPLQTDR